MNKFILSILLVLCTILTTTVADDRFLSPNPLPVQVTIHNPPVQIQNGNLVIPEDSVKVGNIATVADPTDNLVVVGPTKIAFNEPTRPNGNQDLVLGSGNNAIVASAPFISLDPSTGKGTVELGSLRGPNSGIPPVDGGRGN